MRPLEKNYSSARCGRWSDLTKQIVNPKYSDPRFNHDRLVLCARLPLIVSGYTSSSPIQVTLTSKAVSTTTT